MGKKHHSISQAELLGLGSPSTAKGAVATPQKPSAKPSERQAPAKTEPAKPSALNLKEQGGKKPTMLSPTDLAFAGTPFPINDPTYRNLAGGGANDNNEEESEENMRLSSPRGKLVAAERSAKLRRDISLGKRRVGEKPHASDDSDMMSDASTSDDSGFASSDAVDLDDELCADDASANTSDSSQRYGAMNQGDDGNGDDSLDRSSDLDDGSDDDYNGDVEEDDVSITSSILAELEREGVLDDDDSDYAEAAAELNKASKDDKTSNGKKRSRGGHGDDEDFIIRDKDGQRQQMVHFDGFPYTEDDLENSLHLLDSFIPDHMLEVDRDAFAAMLRSRDSTIIIKQGDDSDDDEDDDAESESSSSSSEEENENPLSSKPRRLEADPNVDLSTADDIFGIYGLVDICTASNANKRAFADMTLAFRRLMDSPWLVLESGVRSVGDLLGASVPNTRLLVMDCLKTIPPDVSAASLRSLLDSFSSGSPNFNVVVLAKAQRSADAIEADYAKKKLTSKSKKHRAETPSAASGSGANVAGATLNLKEEYVFWRLTDEVLYEHRDPQTSVTLYKNRAQYDDQPDNERPLSIGFSLTWDSFKKAVAECARRSAETTGFGAM